MLSLRELRRAADVLSERFAGHRLERLVQPGPDRIALVLYGREGEEGGAKRHLLLVCGDCARVCELGAAPSAPPTPPAFASFLRARLTGARMSGARVVGDDRQLALRFEGAEGGFDLLLSLLGRRSNLYLLDAQGMLLRALRPLEETRPELAVGEPWRDPSGGLAGAGEDRFADRADADFLAAIEESYAEREQEQRGADLERRLATALRKERKQAEKRLARLEQELAEADEANELQRRGELLKTVLGDVRPGQSEVRARDFATGEEVAIPLDPAKTAKQNLDATFKRYQKLIRRLTKAGGQVEGARERLRGIEELEAGVAAAAGAPEALAALAQRPDLAALLARNAPAQRPAPPPRRDEGVRIGRFRDVPRSLQPRRYQSRDGLEIWVGRSDEGNDFLSTRLARGNDLFFHLDGAPGSHVVLRTEGRSDPPSESLLDACELAVHFSKARKASHAEVHVVPIKQVHKPKGAKAGLVYVTGGKSIRLRREEQRLERLLASRLED